MAGRPPGYPKSGGRKAGTPNKKSRERVEAILASGETPLDYMLRIMRDPTVDHQRRDDMAKAAGSEGSASDS